jgi:hypothetical protein
MALIYNRKISSGQSDGYRISIFLNYKGTKKHEVKAVTASNLCRFVFFVPLWFNLDSYQVDHYRKIYLLLISILTSYVVSGQCGMTLTTSSTSASCTGCNNGIVSVNVSGGVGPYTYRWTNNVVPGTVSIGTSKDNSIYEETVTNSYGAGQYLVAGMTNAGFRNRALMAFNIAGNVPAGATITNASLQLSVTLTSGASGPQSHFLHRLLQDWGEGTSTSNSQPGQGVPATTGDATWLKTFFPSSDWTIAGGNFNGSPSASTIVHDPALYTWSSAGMIADIQSWLDNPSSNFGWLLKSDETGNRQAKRYGSKENVISSNKPVLTINYGPAVFGNTASVPGLAPGVYTVTATDVNLCTATATVTVGVSATSQPPVFTLDATTYRGAFAPAPEPQWSDGWTNFDPQSTIYPSTTAVVTAVNSDTTWTTGSVVRISGVVYVASGKALTIQPGVIVRADETVPNSLLLVARGARIKAIGTQCNPIIFTSNKAAGARAPGDWGGIVVLGNGLNNQGSNAALEGLPSDPRNTHGGTNDEDNSGVLRFVRIEFGGFTSAPGSNTRGLTLGSVGRQTSIDYVQCSFINSDAIAWLGGSVDAKHIIAYRCAGNDFDTDKGYHGSVQFGLAVKDPSLPVNSISSVAEGIESDNDAGGSSHVPKTSAKFYNITQIGAFRCNSNVGIVSQPLVAGFRRGTLLRRNTELKIFNSIFMNNWRGLLADAPTLATAGLSFQNNIIAGDFSTAWTAPYAGVSLDAEDGATAAFLNTSGFNNTQVSSNACDLLTNVWGGLATAFPSNPDFRPNANSALATGATAGADILPIVEIDNALFIFNQSVDFLVDILENGAGSTNGSISITIPKPSGWNITVPGLTLSSTGQPGINGISNVGGGTPNSNGNWILRDDGTNVIATSKPGVVVAAADFVQIGFTATRKTATAGGTNQNLNIGISGGGDGTPANNSAVTTFSAN